MKLDKQYHGGHQAVNIDDIIQHPSNSGPDIVCVVVLRKDGGLDVYSVPNNELKSSKTGPRSTEAPGPPSSICFTKSSSFLPEFDMRLQYQNQDVIL